MGEMTRLVVSLPCCRLKQEEKHLDLYSRKCKTRNLHCFACNVPSVIIISAKHGCGGSFGWQSSQISSVPNLRNTKQNMRKKLQSPRRILIRLFRSATKLLLSMRSLCLKRTNIHLHCKVEDLPYKISSTRPTGLKA